MSYEPLLSDREKCATVCRTGGGVGYQLLRGSRWVPLLNHCWVPCWMPLPLLGAIGGCHAREPLPGCHAMGAIAGVPLLGAIVGAMAGSIARCHLAEFTLGAIAGRHCLVPLLGCHCSVPLLGAIAGGPLLVPLWGAMAGCHCWMPLLVPLLRAIARNK